MKYVPMNLIYRAEKFDEPVALIVVGGVDNRFADKVNPAWRTPLIPIIDSALEGDNKETVNIRHAAPGKNNLENSV
jgi:hypothetical protein